MFGTSFPTFARAHFLNLAPECQTLPLFTSLNHFTNSVISFTF